ncbi:MAG: hypothetical protein GF331_12560 [Chitinivibrionales bacterium]|nr:hypothetical protein [Chitinivibrionales bacterium]
MRFTTVLLSVLLAVTAYGQSIVTPVFVHKDGEASASGYAGSEKDILVDGGAQQVVGWATFQTVGVDLSQVTSAILTLYAKDLDNPGTLSVHSLTAAVTVPENTLTLASLPVGAVAIASVSLGTADVEKVIQLDITAAVTGGSFHGIALLSGDGLLATFDSKEGNLAPVILLTHDIESAAAKWYNGSGAPAPSLGKDGDYYLETASGDVYAKSTGAWAVTVNIVGPQGDPGVALDDSQALTDKTWSSQKIQSELGTKVNVVIGKGLSSQDYTTAEKTKLMLIEAGAQANPVGTAVGDMQYWDGSDWVMIPAGQPGQALVLNGSRTPQWSQIPGTVSDVEGNVYRTVVIGNQEWTVENWRCTKYNDGTDIPLVTDGTTWMGLSTPAYCWYDNDIANKHPYGALYNWYVVDPANTDQLAPDGWRVPTNADWTALEDFLIANGYNYDGTITDEKIAKSMAAGVWTSIATQGAVGNNQSLNNKSGFSGLPGGRRLRIGSLDFNNQSADGYWWSATESDPATAYGHYLSYGSRWLTRHNYNKGETGFSVRLVRNLD